MTSPEVTGGTAVSRLLGGIVDTSAVSAAAVTDDGTSDGGDTGAGGGGEAQEAQEATAVALRSGPGVTTVGR